MENKIIDYIEHWSTVFGLPVLKEETYPPEDRASLAINLIQEELYETIEAIAKKDSVEIKDGLGDLLWVTVRAMMEFGIDPHSTIKEIYNSNMSKADDTEEDASATQAYYTTLGTETYQKLVGSYYITYRKFDNKVLKSIRFRKPNFK
jgi:NTP pyrophosphatase (non-canonical NTP hydrolase)